jgi:fluoroacetyl-CoA thioesterase
VGARVEFDHLAPSLPGARVAVTAVLEEVSGRRLTFAVEVNDGDRLVGRGRLERMVVDRAGFLEQAGA